MIQERWAVTFAALRLHKIVAVVGPNEYVRHAIEALLLPVHELPRANLQRAFLILTSATAVESSTPFLLTQHHVPRSSFGTS